MVRESVYRIEVDVINQNDVQREAAEEIDPDVTSIRPVRRNIGH
jgi:hypothetical protein